MALPRQLSCLLFLLAMANVLAVTVRRRQHAPLRKPTIEVPLRPGPWHGEGVEGEADWTDASGIGADWMLHRTYDTARGDNVELLVVYDVPGRHSHYSPETCLQNAGWEFLAKHPVSVDMALEGSAADLPVTEAVVQKDGQTRVVLYWYQLGKECFAGRLSRQIALMKEMLRPTDRRIGLNVRINAVAASGDPRQSARVAREFLQAVLPCLTGAEPARS